MKTEIDHELAKQIASCLAEKDETKKRNFLFAQGQKLSVLTIDKKPLGKDKESAAQKKAGAPKCHKGTCFGAEREGAKTLVFVVKDVEPGLERNLKAATKENAGASCRVEVRKAGSDEEVAEVRDKTPDRALPKLTEAEKEQQRAVINKARYKKLLNLVAERMGALHVKDKDQYAAVREKIGPLLAKVEEFAAAGQHKKAIEVLQKIKPHIPKYSYRDQPATDFLKRQQVASEHLKWLQRAGGGAVSEKALPIYRAAVQSYRQIELVEAEKAMTALAGKLGAIRARILATSKLLHHVSQLSDPVFSAGQLSAFNKVVDDALLTDLDQVAPALLAAEEPIRQGQIERDRFIEAMKAAKKLLDQAQKTLDPKALGTLPQEYQTAIDRGEQFDFIDGYDHMTKVDARLRQALRLHEERPRTTVRPLGVRNVWFKLNLDNFNIAVDLLALENFEQAEEFKQLQGKLQESWKKLRLLEPKLLEEEAKLEKLSGSDREKAHAKFEENKKQLEKLNQDELDKMEPMLAKAIELIGKKTTKDGRKLGVNERVRAWPEREIPELQPEPVPNETTVQWSTRIQQDDVLNKVEVGKQLAKGGYGTVNVLKPKNNENVPPLIVKLPTGLGSLEDLQKEANTYQQVGDHPNLLKCLGVRRVDGRDGLILERVQGRQMDKFTESLNESLARGAISRDEYWSTIRYTLTKSLGTLDYLHQKGFGHNDLKPGNVMIDETTGELKIIDLGTLNPLTSKVEGVDSPNYRAPEDFKEHLSTPQTDAFAMGATVHASMKEKDTFHYGSEEGMKSTFLWKVEEVVQAYGEVEGEEQAMAPDEDDPSGEGSIGNTGAGKQFTEFMNLLLHPDPTKRLSPKQALEHPFLRDPTMSDDQVKGLIKRMNQAPLE